MIDLCAAVFDWAQFRTTKGAVKLQLLLDHDGYLPCYPVITEGNVLEIQVARKLSFQRGTMLVFDRGYTDYGWFQRLTEEGVHFVTRLKDNATYVVMEKRPPIGDGVVSDEFIVLEKQAASEQAPFLRRVRYWDPSTQRELIFLTNHLDLAAVTVAAIYKQRWPSRSSISTMHPKRIHHPHNPQPQMDKVELRARPQSPTALPQLSLSLPLRPEIQTLLR